MASTGWRDQVTACVIGYSKIEWGKPRLQWFSTMLQMIDVLEWARDRYEFQAFFKSADSPLFARPRGYARRLWKWIMRNWSALSAIIYPIKMHTVLSGFVFLWLYYDSWWIPGSLLWTSINFNPSIDTHYKVWVKLLFQPPTMQLLKFALWWRHNWRYNVSNHQPHDCLLSLLFRRRS